MSLVSSVYKFAQHLYHDKYPLLLPVMFLIFLETWEFRMGYTEFNTSARHRIISNIQRSEEVVSHL